ncbi:MAG: hypothetical protein ACI841_004597, partial [Planctomycetota bacterium]
QPEPALNRQHEVEFDGEPRDDADFDWQQQGPIDFLEFLSDKYLELDAQSLSAAERARGDFAITVWGIHRGWVLQNDLAALQQMLDDDRTCLGVRMSRSSFILFGHFSTVGAEARFLIDGLKSEQQGSGYRGYPPALNSMGRTNLMPIKSDSELGWSTFIGGAASKK